MAGFKGQAERSVDRKGRLAIPAKMRSVVAPEAGDMFTLTRGLDQCIFVYPQNRWQKMEEELMSLNMFNRKTRHFVRTLIRWAEESTLDGQGRIIIPERLRSFAGIDGQAVIIGALDHIEIWDEAKLEEYLDRYEDDYETVAEQVMGGLEQ